MPVVLGAPLVPVDLDADGVDVQPMRLGKLSCASKSGDRQVQQGVPQRRPVRRARQRLQHPRQRRLRGQTSRLAATALQRTGPATSRDRHPEHRVIAQLRRVVLVTPALRRQQQHRPHDLGLLVQHLVVQSVVTEGRREPGRQAVPMVDFPQHQGAGVGGDLLGSHLDLHCAVEVGREQRKGFTHGVSRSEGGRLVW